MTRDDAITNGRRGTHICMHMLMGRHLKRFPHTFLACHEVAHTAMRRETHMDMRSSICSCTVAFKSCTCKSGSGNMVCPSGSKEQKKRTDHTCQIWLRAFRRQWQHDLVEERQGWAGMKEVTGSLR
eukprot:scaffold52571_cov15-Tisochrysis_lutea.AAC.1